MELNDVIEFISACVPTFSREDGKYKMFTVCTQWIDNNSIEELLEQGIKRYKRVGNISPLQEFFDLIGKNYTHNSSE